MYTEMDIILYFQNYVNILTKICIFACTQVADFQRPGHNLNKTCKTIHKYVAVLKLYLINS